MLDGPVEDLGDAAHVIDNVVVDEKLRAVEE